MSNYAATSTARLGFESSAFEAYIELSRELESQEHELELTLELGACANALYQLQLEAGAELDSTGELESYNLTALLEFQLTRAWIGEFELEQESQVGQESETVLRLSPGVSASWPWYSGELEFETRLPLSPIDCDCHNKGEVAVEGIEVTVSYQQLLSHRFGVELAVDFDRELDSAEQTHSLLLALQYAFN